MGFCDCRRSSFHVVGKVLVEIIRIVVVEVETLRGIALRFFGDTNNEDFTAEVLNFLVLFALGEREVVCPSLHGGRSRSSSVAMIEQELAPQIP